jgi:hypothetical protein
VTDNLHKFLIRLFVVRFTFKNVCESYPSVDFTYYNFDAEDVGTNYMAFRNLYSSTSLAGMTFRVFMECLARVSVEVLPESTVHDGTRINKIGVLYKLTIRS